MPLDRAALDLAVRDYVRDNVGKFSTTGSTRPAAGSSTIGRAGDRATIGKVGDKPGIDRERVDPAGVKTLGDIRRIMRAWRRVPFAQRAALKARLIAKAKTLGADPRLLLLLSGLGDADGKREATEGSSRALRRGNAREWLAKQRGLDMSDPVTALAVDLLDLSPGDYSPPYDWKHGFIPLTPAAVASKAGKGPNAGKGGKRAKAPRKSAAATPKPRKVAAGKPAKAAAPKFAKAATPKPDTSQLATDQRADDARRGGGFPVPPELRNAKTKNGTPFPTVTPMAKASPLNDDPGTSLNGKSAASMTNAERVRAAETMFGTDSPQARAARSKWGDKAPAKRATGADDNGITVGPADAQVSAPGTWTARKRDDGSVQVLSKNGVELGVVRQVKSGKRAGQWEARTPNGERKGADYGSTPEQAIDGLYDSYQGKAGEATKARGNAPSAPAKPAGTGRFADKGKAPEANPRREKFDQAAQASRDGDHAKAARLYGELGDEDKTARERAKAIKAGQDLPDYTAPSVTAEKKADGITPTTVRRMSDDQLIKVLDRLGAAGDYDSPAFKAVEAEQNRRDDAKDAARKAAAAPKAPSAPAGGGGLERARAAIPQMRAANQEWQDAVKEYGYGSPQANAAADKADRAGQGVDFDAIKIPPPPKVASDLDALKANGWRTAHAGAFNTGQEEFHIVKAQSADGGSLQVTYGPNGQVKSIVHNGRGVTGRAKLAAIIGSDGPGRAEGNGRRR